MKSIELESNVGSCAIALKVLPLADKMQEIAKQALLKLVAHDASSKAFSAKSKLDRNSAYSAELDKAVREALKVKLEPFFVIESLETEEKVKLSDEDKFVKSAIKIGLNEAQAKDAWKQAQANKAASAAAETAKPTEAKLEPKTVE
jgi:IS30 family transposase